MSKPNVLRSGRPLGVLSVVCLAVFAAWIAGAAAAHGESGTRGSTLRVSISSSEAQGDGGSYNAPAMTPDGRFVAYANGGSNLAGPDTNGQFDVFVRDRTAGTTRRVSVSSSEGQ